jgi:hypothetical protein
MGRMGIVIKHDSPHDTILNDAKKIKTIMVMKKV